MHGLRAFLAVAVLLESVCFVRFWETSQEVVPGGVGLTVVIFTLLFYCLLVADRTVPSEAVLFCGYSGAGERARCFELKGTLFICALTCATVAAACLIVTGIFLLAWDNDIIGEEGVRWLRRAILVTASQPLAAGLRAFRFRDFRVWCEMKEEEEQTLEGKEATKAAPEARAAR